MKFLTKSVTEEGLLNFTLGNGLSVIVDMEELNEAIRKRAMQHGLLQKIGDAASGFAKAKDYQGAFNSMQATVDALFEGEWNRRGAGTGIQDLVLALMAVTGREQSECQEAVDKLDEEQRKALVKDKQVKAELARIRYERAKEKAATATTTDIDGLFG